MGCIVLVTVFLGRSATILLETENENDEVGDDVMATIGWLSLRRRWSCRDAVADFEADELIFDLE